jgi:hypothetical protein
MSVGKTDIGLLCASSENAEVAQSVEEIPTDSSAGEEPYMFSMEVVRS